ncbi:MAG TPA: site-specific integrase [Bacteroidia bacterium]|nr:site-specific integrase [Bacteroidia bacterium]
MPTANFFLEKRIDKLSGLLITENVPIYLDFSFNGKRLQQFTGFRVDADKWDDGIEKTRGGIPSRKRIHSGKVKRNFSLSSEINSGLTALTAKLNEIYESATALKIPITVEYLRNELKNDPSKKRSVNIFEAYELYIEEKKNKDSVNTIKKYRSTLNHLKEFFGNRQNVEFIDLNLTTLERFKGYLIREAKHTHNTVVKYCKALKAFIRWASNRGYSTNPDYEKFKIEGEKEPAIIYLNWDELFGLYELKIDSEALRQVRDVFCFGCFTGQRYSDIANLKPEHIIDGIWANVPIKSHNARTLYIPLNSFALKILERYRNLPTGRSLPVISNQKMNDQLKDLGQLAGLISPVTIYRFLGGRRIEKTVQKYEVLTTHVMRKTFVTNALSLGMQTATIKEFTGHKSEKDFNRYLAVITEDKIKAMKIFDNAGTRSRKKTKAR